MVAGIGGMLLQMVMTLKLTFIHMGLNSFGGIRLKHLIHGNASSGTQKRFMALNLGMLLPAHAREVTFVNFRCRALNNKRIVIFAVGYIIYLIYIGLLVVQ